MKSQAATDIDASRFRSDLAAWYRDNARDLPWRETHDPYRIWVSEIMLQQTQVHTVLGYYDRFLKRFPTVGELASADESDVLQQWSGLGYYRRARQMHLAAQKIADRFDGVFPDQFDQILSLPGIGRYTAGAIASFAYDQAQPIVEANTSRLHARLLAVEKPLVDKDSQRKQWELAEHLLPEDSGTRELNQALMELGSLVCKPEKPQCMLCPVSEHCHSFKLGKQDRIPVIKPKEKPTPLVHGLVVLRKGNQVLLRQAEPGQWWEGLWEFPRLDLTATIKPSKNPPSSDAISDALVSEYAIDAETIEFHSAFTHAVTRYRIRAHCYTATPGRGWRAKKPLAWYAVDELPALSAPAKKLWKSVS